MKGGRLRRLAAGVAVAVILGTGLVFTAGVFYLRGSVQVPEGTLRFGGDTLADEVQVRMDEYGVPYVAAATQEDLFFAQGFLHASHRLFQMEVLRRTAAGRLAEIFGRAALGIDRVTRTLDLWGAAGRSATALTSGERRLVEAYSAGVNAGIRRRSGPLPPEFLLLDVRPEPWTPRASLAVGKVMALDLSPWSHELARFRASRLLPAEKYEHLSPRYPDWAPTILPDSVAIPGPGDAGVEPPAPTPGAARDGGDPVSAGGPGQWDPLVWLARRAPLHASNAWAVAGSRSASGMPLLANDMHLGLQAPPTWYIMSLRTRGTYRVAGFSLPGVPGIVVGMNPDVAWGFTNGVVDDMEFTVERLAPEGDRFRGPDGTWRRLTVRPETLRVRGREEPVVHRVRSTPRGPLISDALPGIEAPLSVRWTAANPTTEFRGLLAMNRARDAASIDRAIRRFSSPQQNVVYATSDGTVGYRLSGTVPLRAGAAGGLPSPGPGADTGGGGSWPPGSLPATRDPERGYVATANNLQAPNLFGVLGVDYPLPFRARRIVDRLEARRDWDVAAMAALQRDTRSLLAGRLRERAVRAFRRAGLDSAAGRLEAWDLVVAPDRRGPALFYPWLYRLRDLVAADEFASAGPGPTYFPDGALLRLLESGGEEGGAWVDDVDTPGRETLEELEERAAADARDAVRERRWGDIHREVHGHPLGRVPWLDAFFGFEVGPFPGPGGPHTVRPDERERWATMDGSAWRPPLVTRKGPSERFVAEMEPGGTASGHFLVPTGQSGNPFSRHYRDLLPRWRSGRLLEVGLDSAWAAARSVRSFRLAPAAAAETPSR